MLMRLIPAALTLCLALTACGGDSGGSQTAGAFDPAATAQALLDSGAFSDALEEVDVSVAATLYGVDEADITDGKVYMSLSAGAEEIAVLVMANETSAAAAMDGLEKRVADHKAIRDDLLKVIAKYPGCWARPTEGGSYIFLQLPALKVTLDQFVKLCRAQAAVTVTPGTEFGPQFTDSVRLNFSQDHQAAVAAVERICQMAQRYHA